MNVGKLARLVEQVLLIVGVVLMVMCLSAIVHRAISSRIALWRFDNLRPSLAGKKPANASSSIRDGGADFSLWSPQRLRAYRDSLLEKTDAPLAVLQIEKVRLRVPVFEGTDDLTLNRGVGWIGGTAKPGQPGNIGVAGHRDGVFRALKDIGVGDKVELSTANGTRTYFVDQIEIVSPKDVRVLRPRSAPSITLVTCYPFYFVGSAPQRFIVHASFAATEQVRTSSAIPDQERMQRALKPNGPVFKENMTQAHFRIGLNRRRLP